MYPTSYERMGGAEKVQALVDRFYGLMDERVEYREIRLLHPQDLTHAREKLYFFLCGWLGGPSLYEERYGHPRLRARHLPFPIGVQERDQWLSCMSQAMEDIAIEPALRRQLRHAFFMTADHLRNRQTIDNVGQTP